MLLTWPVAAAVITTDTEAEAPDASAPRAQVTVPAALVQPAEAEEKPTPAGRTSTSVTPVAVAGPSLRTVAA